MSEINKLLAEKPKNIGSEALNLALASKKKADESRFSEFYNDKVMRALYYIWKKYDLRIANIAVYIKAEYGRTVNQTYIKRKLIAFEEKLKKTEVKKTESQKDGQYCFSSEKPTKHPTFTNEPQDEVSTDFIDIRELEETKKTVVSQREPATPAKQKSAKKTPAKKSTKKVETPPADEKKSTSKKAEKEVVNNSLPKKKPNIDTNKKAIKKNNQNRKPMSIRDKYPKKTTSKEKLPVEEIELLEVEVIGKGYNSELEKELAERKIREGLLYDRLAAKRRKSEMLTLEENRALYNLAKVDFTPPSDRDEITVPE